MMILMQPVSIGLCEDDADLRSVLGRALGAEGFEVHATSTGHDAVKRFSAEPPDVLVLDIGLPDADGRDVCQALRAHGVDAPVLFLTARGALTDRLAGFGAGAAPGPVDPRDARRRAQRRADADGVPPARAARLPAG
jgi:two-component system response regulator MprA